jgi:Methyltransferase domain
MSEPGAATGWRRPRLNSRTQKYGCVATLARHHGIASLLDLGCRDAGLRHWVPGLKRYVGVDLVQNPQKSVDVLCDLAAGLPFSDRSFEAVAALDLLEHLDDMSGVLGEIDRVTTRLMIIALPNLAHVSFRVGFLFSGRMSSKYDLRYGYGKDRHRWLTVLPQTDAFIDQFVRDRGYRVSRIDLKSTARRHRGPEVLLRALRFSRAWYVYRTVYVIEKGNAAAHSQSE